MNLLIWLGLVWVSGFILGVAVSDGPKKRPAVDEFGDWEGCGTKEQNAEASRLARSEKP